MTLDVTDDTIQQSLVEYGWENWIILARCRALVGGFAAHGALIALWTVGAFVWTVFGARRVLLDALHMLSKLQAIDFTSDKER